MKTTGCFGCGQRKADRRDKEVETAHAETGQIFSIRCSAEQLLTGAEENYISQSAISQQAQVLERELGFPLPGAQKSVFHADLCGRILLSKEPDPDGGL